MLIGIDVVEFREPRGFGPAVGAEVAALLEDPAGAVASHQAAIPHRPLASVRHDGGEFGHHGSAERGVGDRRDIDALDAQHSSPVGGVLRHLLSAWVPSEESAD